MEMTGLWPKPLIQLFRGDRFWIQPGLDVLRDPFSGLGKPEPLKYLGSNIWSKRLSLEHRVVYLVRDDRIDFLQARYHY